MQHENGWRLVAPKNADQHAVVIRGYSRLDMVVQHIRGVKGYYYAMDQGQRIPFAALEGNPYTGNQDGSIVSTILNLYLDDSEMTFFWRLRVLQWISDVRPSELEMIAYHLVGITTRNWRF